MRLNPHFGSFRSLPTKIAARCAVPLLLLGAQTTVIAQTQTVRVEVAFVERIEVTQASPTQSAHTEVAKTAVQSEPPGSDATADESFVTALGIQATPRRAVTLHVETSAASDAASFLCTYGSVQQAECGGAGVAAVSLAEAELTIDRGTYRSGNTVLGAKEQTDIEITITYQ